MGRVYSHVLPDGTLAIIRLANGDPDAEGRRLARTLFELHRSELANGVLSGDVLAEWRQVVHYGEYDGDQSWTANDISDQELPPLNRRHAWRERVRDGITEVYDDTSIPDL